jgi:hypothetical protein
MRRAAFFFCAIIFADDNANAMKPRRTLAIAAMLACFLSGCGGADSDPGPGGVTHEEARELDEAAEKLDTQPAQVVEEANKARPSN